MSLKKRACSARIEIASKLIVAYKCYGVVEAIARRAIMDVSPAISLSK